MNSDDDCPMLSDLMREIDVLFAPIRQLLVTSGNTWFGKFKAESDRVDELDFLLTAESQALSDAEGKLAALGRPTRCWLATDVPGGTIWVHLTKPTRDRNGMWHGDGHVFSVLKKLFDPPPPDGQCVEAEIYIRRIEEKPDAAHP